MNVLDSLGDISNRVSHPHRSDTVSLISPRIVFPSNINSAAGQLSPNGPQKTDTSTIVSENSSALSSCETLSACHFCLTRLNKLTKRLRKRAVRTSNLHMRNEPVFPSSSTFDLCWGDAGHRGTGRLKVKGHGLWTLNVTGGKAEIWSSVCVYWEGQWGVPLFFSSHVEASEYTPL